MNANRLLITGSNGFLGNNLARYFISKGYEVYGVDIMPVAIRPEVRYHCGDLSDYQATCGIFDRIRPDHVINTIALVDLDLCEENKALAHKINVQTAENIAKCSSRQNARLLHISTDHLFDGTKSFYLEDDRTSPVNNYGLTKLMGERACLNSQANVVSVRTNFYGWSHSSHKPTFGEWMYESLAARKIVHLYQDYYFTPIEVTFLAEALESLLNSEYMGIVNVAGAERCSKYEFGMNMAEVFGLDASAIIPTRIDQDPFKVKRQPDLSLSVGKCEKLLNIKLPDLRTGLERFKVGLPK